MKRIAGLTLIAAFLLSGCGVFPFTLLQRVVEYPLPEVTVEDTWFEEQGCYDSADCLPASLGALPLAIKSIDPAPEILGALTPRLPIAVAGSYGYDETQSPVVYTAGCMLIYSVRYLVVQEGELQLLEDAADLKALYAPIENEDEALAYAVAVTGLSALNDLEKHPRYHRYTRPLVESHASFDGSTFKVLLYHDNLCGCGPHIVSAVEVTVRQDGSFSLGEPIKAFRDPLIDTMCID